MYRLLVYGHVADVLQLWVGVTACMRCSPFFMRHTSKRAAPGLGMLLVSQDSLQLRAQHNDRECQQLNRPNLSIFSKILAAKPTLPPTRSSQCLQTIILFFSSCCIWLFQIFSSVVTPKTFVYHKSDLLGGILITSAFWRTTGNLSTR